MSSALIMQSPCTAPRKKQVLSQRLQTVNQQHIPDDGLLLSHWKIKGQPLIFIHEINTTTNWITAHGQMQQPGDVPQDELVESTGRCSDQQRSREVKLFHYERTRVVFIHSLLLLRRGGLRGNGDGYLTLEAKGLLQTIQCFSHYWWRSGNCSTDTHWEEATKKKKRRKGTKKVAGGNEKFTDYPSLEWSREHAATQAGWTGCSDSTHCQDSCTATQFKQQ